MRGATPRGGPSVLNRGDGALDSVVRETRARPAHADEAPPPLPAFELTAAERKLAELLAYSLLLQEGAGRVVPLLVDPASIALMGRVREAGGVIFERGASLVDDAARRSAVRDLASESHNQARSTMQSFLPAGFAVVEGLDYLAMALAETIGHWSLLPHLDGATEAYGRVGEEVITLLRPHLTQVIDAASRFEVRLN
ncbi:MAG: hypothetical protein M3Y45_04850 [Actinomycetota bacterium]|nr:hypothetical protein [Actinomycetota bacterium]